MQRRSYFETTAAVQGVGFAFAMVNHDDLERVFATTLPDPALERALQAGIGSALAFWDWLFPDTLASLPAHELVEQAETDVASARQRGGLVPFGLA